MANINRYKSRTWAFFASSHHKLYAVYIYIYIYMYIYIYIYIYIYVCISRNWKILSILSSSRCTTFSKLLLDGKECQIPDFLSDGNSSICSVSHHLRDIRTKMLKYRKCWPWKRKSGSTRINTGLAPFDWKCSNPIRLPFS